MSEFVQKWALIKLLEPVDEGSEFFWKDFPLHVTIAGIFAIGLHSNEIFDLLSEILEDQKTIFTTATKEAHWGVNQEIFVMQLEKTPEIMALHNRIIDELKAKGAIFDEPQYIGEGYIPHSTVQKKKRLNKDEILEISEITIVDMFPDEDGLQRRILKTIKLK